MQMRSCDPVIRRDDASEGTVGTREGRESVRPSPKKLVQNEETNIILIKNIRT